MIELSSEDQLDLNTVTVTITDRHTPIVVLFGPPASGKTLALMRMIRFLEKYEYQVIPEEVFRPKTDRHYARMCANLKKMVYDQNMPEGAHTINFMLVRVLNPAGRPVCQILKAPGEHYFNCYRSAVPNLFHKYIDDIRTAPNRKTWVFFVEQGWGENQEERNLYAQKICSMQNLISPNDKVVFLFNKADKHRHDQYNRSGKPVMSLFFSNIASQYPGIFTKYQNSGMLKLLYGQYNFKAVCFSSGFYTPDADGRVRWIPGDDWYCSELWKVIK
ncbi:MAG: ATP-binding protein [Bacteroidales bacterium]|nr:ATP-binding protein [Bacteroidales bacterium]